MAIFNPNPPEGDPPSRLGYSGGPVNRRFLGTLFEGIGDAVAVTASALDQKITKDISDDAHAGIEYIRDYYGVNAAADQAAPSLFAGMDPGHLQDSADFLQELQDGYISGAFSETHYYGQLQTMVRALRTRYPGYEDQIDDIVQGITGITPANSLVASLRRDAGDAAAAIGGAQDDILKWINDHEELINYAWLEMTNGEESFSSLPLEEQLAAAAFGGPLRGNVGRLLGLAGRLDVLRNDIEVGDITAIEGWQTAARDYMTTTLNLNLNLNDEDVGTFGNMQEITEAIMRGANVTPEEYGAYLTSLGAQISEARTQLTDLAFREFGVPVGQTTAVREYIDSLLEPYEEQLHALGAEDYDLYSISQAVIHFQEQPIIRRLYEVAGSPLTMMRIIKDNVSPEFQAVIARRLELETGSLDQTLFGPVVNFLAGIMDATRTMELGLPLSPEQERLVEGLHLSTRLGVVNINDTFVTVLDEFGLDTEEGAAVINLVIGSALDVIESSSDPRARTQAYDVLFRTGGGIDLSDYHDAADQRRIYSMLTAPGISESIHNMGNTEIWSNYREWVMREWGNINRPLVNEISRDVNNISAATANPMQYFDLVFNSETGLFSLQRNEVPVDTRLIGDPEVRMTALRRNITNLNQTLAGVQAMLAQTGRTLTPDILAALMADVGGIPENWNIKFVQNEEGYTPTTPAPTTPAPTVTPPVEPAESPPVDTNLIPPGEPTNPNAPLLGGTPLVEPAESPPVDTNLIPPGEPTNPNAPLLGGTPPVEPAESPPVDTNLIPPGEPTNPNAPLLGEMPAGLREGMQAWSPEGVNQLTDPEFIRELVHQYEQYIGEPGVVGVISRLLDRYKTLTGDELLLRQNQRTPPSGADMLRQDIARSGALELPRTSAEFNAAYSLDDPDLTAEDYASLRDVIMPSGMTVGTAVETVRKAPTGTVTPVNLAEMFIGANENNPAANRVLRELFTNYGGGDPLNPAETAWCARFVKSILQASGYDASSANDMARSFLNVGTAIARPQVGDIVVFWRGSREGSLGHVGFFMGFETIDGVEYVRVLGGNQSNSVNESYYSVERVLGYRHIERTDNNA